MNQTNPYMIRCRRCGTKNRIPADSMMLPAKCGKCGVGLKTDELLIGQPVNVTDEDFETRVLKSALPVLMDCWAPWCGVCRTLAPVMDELALQLKGRVRICKLDVEQQIVTASMFQIRGIPTLLIFDNGQLKDTIVGSVPKEQVLRKLSPYL